jgi:tRNA modification GTPase
MSLHNNSWNETIVALATPPGIGAIGVVRLSGSQAFSIANKLFPSKDLEAQPSHTVHVGYLRRGDEMIDEAVITLFKGPRSYTGEDVVEISGHGSPYILEKIVQACIAEGARPAKPGEFTLRAFLQGKLDLTQAEAVADLIASNTAASHHTALHNIRGGFSDILKILRERLVRFSALIELELDFSQEDVEFADRTQLYQLINELDVTTGQLIRSFQLGNVVKNGVSVAIIGAPNAGKSTLLNALLNENRALVSDIAGTTRDTIEEILTIDGILFRLIDTAGIREHTTDIIESMGIEKSLEKMKQAQLVVYLFDVVQTTVQELQAVEQKLQAAGTSCLLTGNKTDKVDIEATHSKFALLPHIVFISAKEGWHLDLLKQKMTGAILSGEVQTGDTLITNVRHLHALQEVQKSLHDTRTGLDEGRTGDLVALDIRRCLHYLGEITGEITNEDQLDYIFSKFCIGK